MLAVTVEARKAVPSPHLNAVKLMPICFSDSHKVKIFNIYRR